MEEVIVHYPSRVYIYGLVDPRSNELFYVGQSRYPQQRLSTHCISHIQKPGGWYKQTNPRLLNRIQAIVESGSYPGMKVLCFTDQDNAGMLESNVIMWYRRAGYTLLNMAN